MVAFSRAKRAASTDMIKKAVVYRWGVFKGNPTPMKFLVPEFVDHFVQLF